MRRISAQAAASWQSILVVDADCCSHADVLVWYDIASQIVFNDVVFMPDFTCMIWYGMPLVWYGMVWYGMVWYGMVWYGRGL